MMKKNKKYGFTLIEIIVVLVIIAILAAIAIPSVIGYVKDAKASRAISDARSVYIATQAEMVIAKNEGTIPSVGKKVSDIKKEPLKSVYTKARVEKGVGFYILVDSNGNIEELAYLTADKAYCALYTKARGKFIATTYQEASEGDGIYEELGTLLFYKYLKPNYYIIANGE